METHVQKRKVYKKYITYYINLPKQIVKKAKWLKRQKVVDVDVDLLGNVVIKPE